MLFPKTIHTFAAEYLKKGGKQEKKTDIINGRSDISGNSYHSIKLRMLGEAKTKTRPFCQRSKTFGYLILRNKYSLFWPQKQELPQFF